MAQRSTAIIEREDKLYVAFCRQFDTASQEESVAETRDNRHFSPFIHYPAISPAIFK